MKLINNSPIIAKNKLNKKRLAINNGFKKLINPNIPEIEFDDTEIAYISNPYDCKLRNKWISKTKDITHICDAYACIGGDTIQFMALKPNAKIDAIQLVDNNRELKKRYNRLKKNISNFSYINPNVKSYPLSISEFILKKKCKTVDFLYCDPPWADLNNNWYDCQTLVSQLIANIILPLNKVKHYPKYICFKVPYEWNEFKIILNNFKNYKLKLSMNFYYNNYWMHIIKLKKKI